LYVIGRKELNKIPLKIRPKNEEVKKSKLSKQTDLIYDLRLENSQLKEKNDSFKNRLSDLTQALKSNKELLIEMSDKFNSQLTINHKNLNK
jgi:hypothetical protein